MDQYRVQLCSPLPKFLCTPEPVTCAYPFTQYPKGVHFTVTQDNVNQHAELSATTLGIDYINGSYSGLAALLPITDVNGPWIHVAITDDCTENLVRLLCCIATELEVSLPIIAASDLQTDRPELLINPQLQNFVDTCFISGGLVNPPNVFELEERVEQLEVCCENNTSNIILLQQSVQTLNSRVTVVEQRLTGVEQRLTVLDDLVTTVNTLEQQVIVLSNLVNDILQRCCPQQTAAECFQYQLLPGDEQLITANQCVRLNAATKIEDRDNPNCTTGCEGPIVQPGPMWTADLTGCTWQIEAQVRFRLSQWCAGKKASMYIVVCGKKYLFAEYIIPVTGLQVVTLTGTFLLPAPGCDSVHFLVCNSDDKITTAHIVEFANIRGCCLSS